MNRKPPGGCGIPPFLSLVAKAYAEHCSPQELSRLCFVFPNKRAGTFFLNHLADYVKPPYIEPEVIAVNDLMIRFTVLEEATFYDQLFVLYREYCSLSPTPVEFDRFYFWGEMLLHDFNDVDRYMVDPESLFINLKRLREISADYLTPEQKELIRRYWGDDALAMHGEIDRFWRHVVHDSEDGDGHNLRDKFVALWEVLAPLYRRFTDALDRQGLATAGRLSRVAAEYAGDAQLQADRYVFVGFNVLNTAESVLFKRLKARGVADFYFDINSPSYRSEANRAARFVQANAREFPSLYPLDEPEARWPHIETIGVPGNIGQAKMISSLLQRMKADGTIADPSNAIDTAVALPDESLFIPLLHSLPYDFGPVNVTMGFPLRLTPVAAMLHQIVALQRNVRTVHGSPAFFHGNIRSLCAGNLFNNIDSDSVKALLAMLDKTHAYTIDAVQVRSLAGKLAPVFVPLTPASGFEDIYRYIVGVLDMAESAVSPSGASGQDVTVEQCLVAGYRLALDNLAAAVRRYGISPGQGTVFGMVERAIAGDKMQLVGEPIRGLQVMGMLETRSLDFDNVIISSMNESLFPRKLFSRSFIPETLRRAYGMSTIEFQESVFAYYFYRLISRARRVTLLYDSRDSRGAKEGEPSRYIVQLRYMFPESVLTHREMSYRMSAFDDTVPQVVKDERVMKLLDRFRTPGSGSHLSASSLKRYINCPLGFYLQYVEGLGQMEEAVTYLDDSTFGRVVHDSCQAIYEDLAAAGHDNIITADALMQAAVPHKVSRYLTRAINGIFYNRAEEMLDTPLDGEIRVMAEVVTQMICAMMREDARLYAPIQFIEAERKYKEMFHIADGLDVNFTFIIDRLDRAGDDRRLRIVDYKTGSDEKSARPVDDLFNPDIDHSKRESLFQLLLYGLLYDIRTGSTEPIMPVIYSLRNVYANGLAPFGSEKNPLLDHRQYMEQFTSRLTALLREMFDSEVPFKAADNDKSCRFCSFKDICGRSDSEN